MKQVLFAFISVTLLASCMTVPPKVDFGIKSNDVRRTVTRKVDNTIVNAFEPQSFVRGIFEDSLIMIVWRPDLEEFAFELTNKTDHTISINWDEVVFIDENNMPINVMHKGIRYIKRNETQKPSVIPAGTTHRDIIIPTENVHLFKWTRYYNFNYPLTYYYWYTQRIYDESGGGKCAVHIPISVQSLNHTYLFTFEFTEAQHDESILDLTSHNEQIRKAKNINRATFLSSATVLLLVIFTLSS